MKSFKVQDTDRLEGERKDQEKEGCDDAATLKHDKVK